MRPSAFVLERPSALEELPGLWERYGPEAVSYLGGGTDLLVQARRHLAAPRVVVALKGVSELRGIRQQGEHLVIGAATRLREVAEDPLVRRHFPALAEAAGRVGSPQLRNMGTLGGNVCLDARCLYYDQPAWPGAFSPCFKRGGRRCHVAPGGRRCWALFCADTPPALLAHGARFHLRGPSGERRVAAEEFYADDGLRPSRAAPGELLAAVELPLRSGAPSAYRRVAARRAIDFPWVGVAVSVGGREAPRVAATGVASRPLRLSRLEELLAGGAPSALGGLLAEGLRTVRPMRHPGLTPGYRKALLTTLLEDVLRELSTGVRGPCPT